MFLKRKLAFVLVPLLLFLAMPYAASADTGATAQPQQISLAQAIKMADSSNLTLLQDQLAVQMDNNISTSAIQAYDSAGGAHAASIFGNSVQASTYNSMLSAANTLQNANLALAAEQNNVIYGTEAAYFKVQDAVYGEQAAEEAVAAAQEAYLLAQVQELQSVQTTAYVGEAKSALDLAQSKLTQSKDGVEIAYVKLDQAVGLDLSARPDLTSSATYDPRYTPGLADVQEAVSETFQNNASAQSAQNNYDLAIQEAVTYQGNSENAALSVQDAQTAYLLATQTLKSSATSAFTNVGADQNAYEAAAKAAEAAQATYSDAQASYNVGMDTKYQVDADKATLTSDNANAQAGLHQLVEDRANLALITGVGSVNVPVAGN